MLVVRHPILMSPVLVNKHETHVFTGRTSFLEVSPHKGPQGGKKKEEALWSVCSTCNLRISNCKSASLASYNYRCVHSHLGFCNVFLFLLSGEILRVFCLFSVFFHYSYMVHLSFKKRMKSIGCLVWSVEFFENGGARQKNCPTR